MEELIKLSIRSGDALSLESDVLVLKYAQSYYGLDAAVSKILVQSGMDPEVLTPKPTGFRFVDSVPGISAKHVLFVGVVDLYSFDYAEIRDFSRRVLSALAGSAPSVNRITLTLHGAGYGLDEVEALESEVAGLMDAIRGGDFPEELQEIVIVERNNGRANRLNEVLQKLLPDGGINLSVGDSDKKEKEKYTDKLRSVGYASAAKEHVFVAMPFKEEMDDVYHYGIQGAIRNSGFLCERADLSSFTGDVMDWVRKRIKTASLVVADLTESNPNVYLEVGYAWGCGVPTVLLVNDADQLKFDTRSQRCLTYKSIRNLESLLEDELVSLREQKMI